MNASAAIADSLLGTHCSKIAMGPGLPAGVLAAQSLNVLFTRCIGRATGGTRRTVMKMRARRPPPLQPYERVVWAGHSSWADHAILFLFMGLAAVRAAAAARLGDWWTVLLYLLTIGVFSGIAALFHYMEYYQISSQRIRITTGFWLGHTKDIPLSWIRSVTIRRLPFNGWFDIGTIEVQASASEGEEVESVMLKGLPDPERLKRQVDMLAGLREPGLRDMMNTSE